MVWVISFVPLVACHCWCLWGSDTFTSQLLCAKSSFHYKVIQTGLLQIQQKLSVLKYH